MVVEFLHTFIAVATVLGTHGTDGLAGVANVEDWVVVVPVVAPGRWVSNL